FFLRLEMELAAVDGNDDAGIDDGGTGNPTLLDGLAESGVGVIAGVADVAHGGEAGLQHGHAVPDALNGAVGSGIEERGDVVVVGVALGNDGHAEVGMSVEETGKNGRV